MIKAAAFSMSLFLFACLNTTDEMMGRDDISVGVTNPHMSPSIRAAYDKHLGTKQHTKIKQITGTGDFCPLSLGPQPRGEKVLAKRAAIGNIVGPHTGGLSKRNFTWSIIRNYTGYTPDNISDEMVEIYLQHAVSSWASVANIGFSRVESGGDVTFEWVDSMNVPCSLGMCYYPTAAGLALSKDGAGAFHPTVLSEAHGAKIIFANKRREPNGTLQDIDWTLPNRILVDAMHELGHFLGMWHAFNDPNYGNAGTTGQACDQCLCSNCTYPYINDQSIMGYDYRDQTSPCASYLSAYDVSVITQKYGSNSYGRPLLELWIPNWSKHFYTNSWEEANPLVRSGFASDVNWFHGMILKNHETYTAPVHRHYTEESGVGPKHYYSSPYQLYSPTPIWYEGVMGYVMSSAWSGVVPLYKHYASFNDDHMFTSTSATSPFGYVSEGVFGHIVPYDNMWPAY